MWLIRATLTAVVCLLGGCAGGAGLPQLGSGTTTDAATVSVTEGRPVGSPTEIYSRVAQGAVGCWFGPNGPLKLHYIYHAEADAPSRGGKAEIVVHERDPTQPNPRGAKSYKVRIEPTPENSSVVTTENLRMPEAVAKDMTFDVERWSRGDQGCVSQANSSANWGAVLPAAKPEPAGQPKQTAKKLGAEKSR